MKVTISERAVRRQLKKWGITRRNAARDVSALPIISHHHIMENDDETSAASLNSQGIPASSRQAQRARLENDLRARDRTAEQRDEQRQQTAVAIGESLAEGTTRNFGRQYMKTALQINHSQRARKQDIQAELALQDPVDTASRRPGRGKHRRRFEYVVPCPDHLWSIDGHDKPRRWGIEIYGAIDAYSRRIIWLYVGISNRA